MELRRGKGQSPPGRLNINVDPKLKAWVAKYAKKHRVSLTELVQDHWRFLRQNSGASYVVLRLNKDFRKWLLESAKIRQTTPEQLIIDQLVRLREEEKGIGVQQI